MSVPVVQPLVIGANLGVTLRNSQVARQFSITPAWKTLRLGIRFVFTSGSSGTITGTPRFTLGFCSGSDLFGDATTGHFAGIQTNDANMLYVSNGTSYNNASNYAGTIRTLKKIGATETQFTADIEGANTFFVHERSSMTLLNKCSVIFFDLARPPGTNNSGSLASGSYTGSYGRWTDWQSSNYFVAAENEFLTQLASTSPTFAAAAWSYTSAGTFYINETQDGYFDSVNVSWNHESPDSELKLMNIGVAVIA